MNAQFRDEEIIVFSNLKLTQRTLIQKSSHHSNNYDDKSVITI